MERLDKVISSQLGYSRKEVKELIKRKRVSVNNQLVDKSDYKINLETDKVSVDNQELTIKKYLYLILNKPKEYVSATTDNKDRTVLDLVPQEYLHRNLFPAGRLDKDTTGLMIITDDGNFAHEILSPKKHIKKTYNVTIDIPVTLEMVDGFQKGVNLNDGECKSAKLEITGKYTALVTLTEGRYHQIKRMFGCYKAKVIELERISMGKLTLPVNLKSGECRELTEEELKKLLSKEEL